MTSLDGRCTDTFFTCGTNHISYVTGLLLILKTEFYVKYKLFYILHKNILVKLATTYVINARSVSATTTK